MASILDPHREIILKLRANRNGNLKIKRYLREHVGVQTSAQNIDAYIKRHSLDYKNTALDYQKTIQGLANAMRKGAVQAGEAYIDALNAIKIPNLPSKKPSPSRKKSSN